MCSLQLMIMRVSSFTLSLLKLLTHLTDRPTDRPSDPIRSDPIRSDPIRSGSVDITRYGKSTESVELTSSFEKFFLCLGFKMKLASSGYNCVCQFGKIGDLEKWGHSPGEI